MQPYQSRGIFVNVDFYAGSVYHLLGIPEDLFVPIFAIGRMPGWCIEILEQYEQQHAHPPAPEVRRPHGPEVRPAEQPQELSLTQTLGPLRFANSKMRGEGRLEPGVPPLNFGLLHL